MSLFIHKSIIVLCSWTILTGCYHSFNAEDCLDSPPEESCVPSYFLKHLNEKERLINDVTQSVSSNCAYFLFFTDAHWGENQKHTPSLIGHIIETTPIEDVIFGGDVITSSFEDPQDAIRLGKGFRDAFDRVSGNKYYIYGNHDNNSDSQSELSSRHLSDRQVFEYLQDGMGNCQYGLYFNFFFDRERFKTRFICLDTGRFYYSRFRDKTKDTVSFLVDALISTPDNWNIVVLTHIWSELRKDDHGLYEPYFTSYNQLLLKVLDDFNSSKKDIFKYNNDSVLYDFSSASSRIVCCIGGHNHLDALLFSPGGIPIIINTTDSRQTINGITANKGTIDEQSISAFVIDYDKATLRRIRIGRGDDLFLSLAQ